LRLLLLR